MAIYPKKDNDAFPLPHESREAFRAFLRRVRDEVFDGVAAEMARGIGLESSNDERNLRRTMAEKGTSNFIEKVDDEFVRKTWDMLFREMGLDAFQYAPTLHGSAILPRIIYRPSKTDDGYVAEPAMNGRYFIDPREMEDDVGRPLHQKFVVQVEGDAMKPELDPGAHLVFVPSENSADFVNDKLYLYRMENSVQIRRLQRLPDHIVRVISENERYDDYKVDLEENDFEIIGEVWGRFLQF